MATNPMQRKARTSFILGFFIALLIGGAIAAFFGFQYIQLKKEKESIKYVKAAVLLKDKKSGEEITQADCTMLEVPETVVPKNYVTMASLLANSTESETASDSKKIIAKVDLTANTALTSSTVQPKSEATTKDLRLQEYNMLNLQTKLNAGDYIDIRLTLPNGQDYIVVSKKVVQDATEDTIWLNMTEEETVVMSNAIIEHYIVTGSKLYATIYVEPGMQENMIPTYSPNSEVRNLLSLEQENGNATLKNNIYGGSYTTEREQRINSIISQYSETSKENIEKGISDEISRMEESRKAFFTSANAVN